MQISKILRDFVFPLFRSLLLEGVFAFNCVSCTLHDPRSSHIFTQFLWQLSR